MTTRANTEIFRCVIEEGFGRGNLDALDDCFPPMYVEHQYGHPSSLEGFKQVIVSLRRAVPDLEHAIDELIESDGKVWARMTARGTHRGSLMGFAPTGRSFAISWYDELAELHGLPSRTRVKRSQGRQSCATPLAMSIARAASPIAVSGCRTEPTPGTSHWRSRCWDT